MKMKRIYVAALLSLSAATLWAQQEMDAYRYSPMDLNGTARSIGMGGAFGALGGDMSAMSHNPAGIAVYRSSELQTTLALTRTDADATWTGVKDSKSLVRMRFDNFSYVGYVPTGYDSGIKAWNFGVAYNRVRDFNRAYHVTGRPTRSLADYAAMRTSTAREQNGRIFGLSEDKLAANSASSATRRAFSGPGTKISTMSTAAVLVPTTAAAFGPRTRQANRRWRLTKVDKSWSTISRAR